MTDSYLYGDAERLAVAATGVMGGISLGTVKDQRFFALRANGTDLLFPFPSRPFTALVNLSAELPEDEMRRYAEAIMRHGCVQAVCRGDDSDRMTRVFEELTESGEYDSDTFVTAMQSCDETLVEAIQYFIIPCDLAKTGLLLVIGDNNDFQGAIESFSEAAGKLKETIGEPVRSEEDLVCFVAT